jgi:prevent-host-death family protein
MDVGIRQLRNQLSKWVARVRNGEEVTITDRGKPVARLVPVDGESKFDRLVHEGVITPARSKRRTIAKPVDVPGVALSEFIDEGRGRR